MITATDTTTNTTTLTIERKHSHILNHILHHILKQNHKPRDCRNQGHYHRLHCRRGRHGPSVVAVVVMVGHPQSESATESNQRSSVGPKPQSERRSMRCNRSIENAVKSKPQTFSCKKACAPPATVVHSAINPGSLTIANST